MNMTQKLIASHLVSGSMQPGGEIAIAIDQTLTQDSTGTMAYLAVRGHGHRAGQDQAYRWPTSTTTRCRPALKMPTTTNISHTVTKKHGIWFSRPGNGICHQVHLERFAKSRARRCWAPTATPPPAAASACWPSVRAGWTWRWPWAAGPTHVLMPKVCRVWLEGSLPPMVSRQGCHSGSSAPPDASRAAWASVMEYAGAGRGDAVGARARHHRQYGRRAGRHHLGFPQRRSDASVL